jgi:hypothetical protein
MVNPEEALIASAPERVHTIKIFSTDSDDMVEEPLSGNNESEII